MDADLLLEVLAHSRLWAMRVVLDNFKHATLEFPFGGFSRGAVALLAQVPQVLQVPRLSQGYWSSLQPEIVGACVPETCVYELSGAPFVELGSPQSATRVALELRIYAEGGRAMAAIFVKSTDALLMIDNPQVLVFWDTSDPGKWNPGYALGREPGRYRFDGMARVL